VTILPNDNIDRRALIHIGWPKTATTSMQRQMRAWPNVAGRPWNRPGGEEARLLMRALDKGHGVSPNELDDLLDKSWHDTNRPVILSDEQLVSLPPWKDKPDEPDPREIPAIWAASSWQRTVIATLREPRSLLRSSYRYSVRGGNFGSYRRYLTEVRDDLDRERGPMLFAGVLRAWEEIVGADAIVVTWMEDFVADHQAFWSHVAGACDVPELARLGDEPTVHLNSNRLAPLWFERSMNALLAPHRGKRRSEFGRHVRRFYNFNVSRHMPKARQPVQIGCEELEAEVVDRLERELDLVCERYETRRPYQRPPT